MAVRLSAGSSRRPAFFVSLFVPRHSLISEITKAPRVNRQIRFSPLRVIGADGSQLGIMDVDSALSQAQEQGLDLVEVAPLARPPVVRIMDFGKYKFEQAKMARSGEEEAACDRAQGGEVSPRDRRSRLPDQDPACARVPG